MQPGILSKPESFYDSFSRKGGPDLQSTHYCPGCGHGNLHKMIAEALDDFGITERTIFVSPVGCSVFGYYYFRCGNVQAAHGRAPAVATAIKRAHPEAIVICYQGDGDLAAIGGNNILHAANRGENITVVFVNNAIYGMTGGQMAPTTLLEQATTTSPYGRDPTNEGYPMRVCELISSLEAPAYVERCALDETKRILKTRGSIRKALKAQIEGKGFSLIEVLSPCPTGWHVEPLEARKWVTENMLDVFPLGVYADRRKERSAPRGVGPVPSVAKIKEALGVGNAGGDVIANTVPKGTRKLVIAGFGGQGVMFLGTLLAQTGMVQGRQVSWLPSYGPEMRGGTANCTVVLSDERIGSPIVSRPDVAVAFNQPSLEKFAPRVRPGGTIIYDSSFVAQRWEAEGKHRIYPIPFSQIANELGSSKALNMVALGAINSILDLFPMELVEAQIRGMRKEKFEELNLRAVAAGYKAGAALH